MRDLFYLKKVCRRYSDFTALHELLQARFPNRILPRVPPATLTAFMAGVASDFAEDRRKALKRWITFVVTHPVISKDPIVKVNR
jgi:sorting nexin-8